MAEFSNLTIKKTRELLDKKEISAKELADFYLKNIEKKNGELNAYLGVYDDVLEQAGRAQKIIDAGSSQALTGIPLAVKDCILIKGKEATAASKILQGYKATYSATATQKIMDQGGVFLGRTNMDEFALGSSTENSALGVTKNPHDLSRVPGGTSGGSAAAVAADMALGALGSDTGGSVRQPAAFCGIVGMKPTYGRVSRYGLMATASSLDCIGSLAKSVTDAEIIYNVIKGKDKMDGTTVEGGSELKKEKIKIGILSDFMEMGGIDPSIKNNFNESVKKLKDLGFEIVDIKIPSIDVSLAAYYIINFAEVSSNLARYDGVRYGQHVDGGANLLVDYLATRGKGFGPESKRRIVLGTYVLSSGYYDAYYNKAMSARRVIKDEFKQAFEKVDAILTPTSPVLPWVIGEKSSPLENYLADVFTVVANFVGVPGISIPSGFAEITGKKIPLGIQLMAPHFGESILFEIGKKFTKEN